MQLTSSFLDNLLSFLKNNQDTFKVQNKNCIKTLAGHDQTLYLQDTSKDFKCSIRLSQADITGLIILLSKAKEVIYGW